MNATGYIVNSILVLLVLRQIRETRLDLVSLVLPVVLVGAAAVYYLHSVPTAGHETPFTPSSPTLSAAVPGISTAVPQTPFFSVTTNA